MAALITMLIGFLLMLFAPLSALAQTRADLDFRARCSAPGVLRCIDFDTAAWIPTAAPNTSRDRGYNFGIMYGGPASNSSRSVIDTAVKASGAGSLKHTFPAGVSGGNTGVLNFFAHFLPCPGAGN